MKILPTGTQYKIRSGKASAVIAEVGATLRSFQVNGREVLASYPDDGAFTPWMGTTLSPWPNRVHDGKYTFDGVDYQLPINEPDRNCALHGLSHALEWRLLQRLPESVSLTATIYPQPGWPGCLRMEITYTIRDETITVEHEASNVGEVAVPYGYGAHPYFAFENVDDVSLSLPFQQELFVDKRLLPSKLGEPNSQRDFRKPHKIGDTALDTAYTQGPKDWEIRLAADTHTVTLWADAKHQWAQVYIPESRTAVALEPMTCGPNAFNPGPTHDGLIRLDPGKSVAGRWGFRVRYRA